MRQPAESLGLFDCLEI